MRVSYQVTAATPDQLGWGAPSAAWSWAGASESCRDAGHPGAGAERKPLLASHSFCWGWKRCLPTTAGERGRGGTPRRCSHVMSVSAGGTLQEGHSITCAGFYWGHVPEFNQEEAPDRPQMKNGF